MAGITVLILIRLERNNGCTKQEITAARMILHPTKRPLRQAAMA